jgi:transcriptional regulator with XRE-family HTH domain
MSLKDWEKKVLSAPGATERIAEIEDELRLAAGLTALREKAGLTQRELADRIGVSQPRVAAIERSSNVTLDVLDQYVEALGGQLEIVVRQGNRRTRIVGASPTRATDAPPDTRRGRPGGANRARSEMPSASKPDCR